MANMYLVSDSDMVAVADALREKSDSTESYTFPNGWINAIHSFSDDSPSYVLKEAVRTAEVVSQRQSESTFSLMAISDAHWLDPAKGVNDQQRYISTSIKHAGMGMNEIKKLVDINLGVVLGDNGWGADGTAEDAAKREILETNKAIAKAYAGIPNLRTPGNHCALDGAIDNEELYDLYGEYNTGATFQSGNEKRGYCYRDFPEHKLRVICMNTIDLKGLALSSVYVQNTLMVSSTQLNWLASVLADVNTKSDAANWRIIILSHHPLDYSWAITSCNILKAYLEGKSFSGTNYDSGSYSCDFSKGNNKAKIIANIHGHNHNYAVAPLHYLVSGNTTAELPYNAGSHKINRICIPNACFLRNNERWDRDGDGKPENDVFDIDYGEFIEGSTSSPLLCNKTMNSGTDTAFAVVTIDSNNDIYVAYYGARPVNEKIVPYKNVVTYSITNNLTNVTTNNASTNTSEGISYSATLTAKSGYEMGTVTIKMGGTDITSSCYSNGAINIPAVTGNVVITAVANEIQTSYMNLLKEYGTSDGYISSSSGGVGTKAGYKTTGFIPLTDKDGNSMVGTSHSERGKLVLHLENITALKTDSSVRLGFYESNKTFITVAPAATLWKTTDDNTAMCLCTVDGNNNVTSVDFTGYAAYLKTNQSKTPAYIRLCASGIDGSSVLTLNELIE